MNLKFLALCMIVIWSCVLSEEHGVERQLAQTTKKSTHLGSKTTGKNTVNPCGPSIGRLIGRQLLKSSTKNPCVTSGQIKTSKPKETEKPTQKKTNNPCSSLYIGGRQLAKSSTKNPCVSSDQKKTTTKKVNVDPCSSSNQLIGRIFGRQLAKSTTKNPCVTSGQIKTSKPKETEKPTQKKTNNPCSSLFLGGRQLAKSSTKNPCFSSGPKKTTTKKANPCTTVNQGIGRIFGRQLAKSSTKNPCV